MRETRLTLPELGLIAGTRGLVGLGVGLLLADRFAASHRKTVGWTLLAVGALSTIPLGLTIRARSRSCDSGGCIDEESSNPATLAGSD